MFLRYGEPLVQEINDKPKMPGFNPGLLPFLVIEFNPQPLSPPFSDEHLQIILVPRLAQELDIIKVIIHQSP